MNTMNTKQQGFSLIELMIVIAIIGVLASIAVPQYNNYIARSQVTEAVTLLAAAKTAVEEQAINTNQFAFDNSLTTPAVIATDATCAGASNLNSAFGVQIKGEYVLCVYVKSAMNGSATAVPIGELAAIFKTTGVNKDIAGKTLIIERKTDGTWDCDSDSTLPGDLEPSNC